MTRRQRAKQRGATILEFSMIGIGLIFVILSFFEMARGMWTYQTLSYAVREGARYASVHGKDCTLGSASCTVTVAQIAGVIEAAGVGLDPNNTTVTLTPASGAATSDTITNLLKLTSSTWPPTTGYAPGQTVKVTAVYPFRTFLAMFWMGGRPLGDSQTFRLGSTSTETIQY